MSKSFSNNAIDAGGHMTGLIAMVFWITAVMTTGTEVYGSPIRLSAVEFSAIASGRVLEDFENFQTGFYGSPLVIANGVYSAVSPAIEVGNPFCNFGLNCLTGQSRADVLSSRIFSMFPAGTQLWGVLDFRAILNDPFQITVIGESGTSVFVTSASQFFGFSDTLGLRSVSFLNLADPNVSFGNYSFDNVVTAHVQVASEPSTVALIAAALYPLLRRRARSGPTGRNRQVPWGF